MKQNLILALPLTDAVIAAAKQEFNVISEGTEVLSPPALLEIAKTHQAAALVVGLSHKIDRAFIKALPASVKVIATSSVGFDHFDVPAAKERGIHLTNTPDVLTAATAELAFLLLLGISRRLPEATALMRSGWGQSLRQNEMLGFDLAGKNLGIFGMGRIGQAMADRARAFGMRILYCNRRRLPEALEKGATYFQDFEEMLSHCHVLSLHAPATDETENIMSARTLSLLPQNAVLINVARGSLVDEEALLHSLEKGSLFGAGLDVFRNEPHVDSRLLNHPRILVTPHIGSATRETRDAMGFRALLNVKAALQGEEPPDALWAKD